MRAMYALYLAYVHDDKQCTFRYESVSPQFLFPYFNSALIVLCIVFALTKDKVWQLICQLDHCKAYCYDEWGTTCLDIRISIHCDPTDHPLHELGGQEGTNEW